MFLVATKAGFAFWNIGALPTWGDAKNEAAREAVIDICGQSQYTRSLESLVFITCDNGDHECGQFSKPIHRIP